MKMILKYMLLTLWGMDQFLRIRLEENSIHQRARRPVWYMIKSLDIVNRIILSVIIHYFGWPEKSIYGARGAQAAFYIVMHGNQRYIEKYIGHLSKAVCIGQAEKMDLARMMDRLLMYRGKKQIYGSQMRRGKNSTDYVIYPIVNPKEVNKRRKKAGFSNTLEEYAHVNQAILPDV